MSLLIELARQFGLPLAGVGALVVAFYGRRVLNAAGRLSAWATTGLILLVVLGIGSLLGWWDVHIATIREHLEAGWRLVGELVRFALDKWATDVA